MAVLGKEIQSRMDERVAVIRAPDIATADPMGKRPAKVLVVDDDPDTCQLLTTLLEGRDLSVEIAADGFEGLEKLDRARPDLVILDVMMHGMDGFETCRKIRARSEAPVIFLSAKTDIVSVARGIDVGGAEYVRKPFTPQELTKSVDRLLNGKTKSEAEELAFRPKKRRSLVFGTLPPRRKLYFALKRFLDMAVAVTALIILSPLMLLATIAIKVSSEGPVIFRQRRIGARRIASGRTEVWEVTPFTMHKFRTMYANTSSETHRKFMKDFVRSKNGRGDAPSTGASSPRNSPILKLANDSRVTPVGDFLRKSSLDELPQLWNILKGEMSLVGPRPELPYVVGMYQPNHYDRLLAKPGLTGLWQVTARSIMDFEECVKLDIWYANNQSIRLDLEILLRTPLAVLTTQGAV